MDMGKMNTENENKKASSEMYKGIAVLIVDEMLRRKEYAALNDSLVSLIPLTTEDNYDVVSTILPLLEPVKEYLSMWEFVIPIISYKLQGSGMSIGTIITMDG